MSKSESRTPDTRHSSLSASQPTIPADNKTSSVIILKLADAEGNPVSGEKVEFISSLSSEKLTTTTESPGGTYKAELRGTTPGTTEITVQVDGKNFSVHSCKVVLFGVPQAKNLIIEDKDNKPVDSVQAGSLLKAHYTFIDEGTGIDVSTVQWFFRKTTAEKTSTLKKINASGTI